MLGQHRSAGIDVLLDSIPHFVRTLFDPAARELVNCLAITPVLSADDARQLIDSIKTTTVKGLRDRAPLAVIVYTFARVGAVIHLRVDDYFQQGKRWWFRFHEKGGKVHEVPAHHKAEAHVGAWIEAAGISEEPKMPLFRTFGRNGEVSVLSVSLRMADLLRISFVPVGAGPTFGRFSTAAKSPIC